VVAGIVTVVSAKWVIGGEVTVVVVIAVVVVTALQALARAVEPRAAPPTTSPASFRNSRLDSSFFFFPSMKLFFSFFIYLHLKKHNSPL
jgi:hypothetical protein